MSAADKSGGSELPASASRVGPDASDEEFDAGAASGRGARLRTFQNNRAAIVGVIILAVFVFLAIAAPLLTSYNPAQQQLAQVFQSPSWQHWFGADHLGRDILTRIMYGGRYTLLIGHDFPRPGDISRGTELQSLG